MIKNFDKKVLGAAIRIGAKSGVENVSTVKLAKLCKISEASVFVHYKTKKNLLAKAYIAVDNKLGDVFSGLDFDESDLPSSVERMWALGVDYFLANPNEARYYDGFRHSPLFDVEKQPELVGRYPALREYLENSEVLKGYTPTMIQVVWSFVLEASLNYIGNVIDGKIEDTDENRKLVFRLIFESILTQEKQ
ncbi:MAG: hypothetical protein RR998_05415 [Oscillospiraceae bacterium]